MRIAFVGRDGSGKTTCAAVFSRCLAAEGLPVLAVDADAGRRLGGALGLVGPPPSGPEWFDDCGRGHSAAGEGLRDARLVDLDPTGELLSGHAVATTDGVRLLATDTLGLCLDHLADGVGEYVVVDLAADASAAGLFLRFDLTVLVTEPTRRAVGIYRQYAEQASGHGVELRVLGNKISDCGDAAWLTEQMGDALVGCFGHSAWVRAAERGTAGPISGLEPGNTAAMAALRSALDARRRTLNVQQGDTAATQSRQCHPAEVRMAYSASRR